ncbi:putative ribonuclease p/mrp subunit [Phyllosticta citricarpa]|uniref:Ribonuclease p/mrp subunit n=1 Tax=Phyllosticta citricarpa TaxID=55181 RepID=A0ABR1LX73_9PEZI
MVMLKKKLRSLTFERRQGIGQDPAGQSMADMEPEVSQDGQQAAQAERIRVAPKTGLGEPLADPQNATVDIIFVHGLGGDRVNTWSTKPTDEDPDPVFWPKDLLPDVCKTARILSFGYDADYARSWLGKEIPLETSLDEYSTSLLQSLAGLRNRTRTSGRPLLFVAHSLGGLVVANALSRQHGSDAASQNIAEATKGVAFLGTPFKGSDMASVGRVVLRVASLFTTTNDNSMKTLQRRSEKAADITSAFLAYLDGRAHSEDGNYLDVACFFEEHSMRVAKSFGFVVDKESATIPGKKPQPIPANHREMCRFAIPEHPGFRSISDQLCQWITALESPSSEEAVQTQTSAIHIGDTIFRERVENHGGVIMGSVYNAAADGMHITGSSTTNYNGWRPDDR